MAVKSTDISVYADQINEVAELHLKGQRPSEIAKATGIPNARVVQMINDWKNAAINSKVVQARAREALAGADQHFSLLTRDAYELNEDAKTGGNLSARNAALKLVLDIEKSRIDMLQKAGLLENKELAQHLAETEERQEALMKIITEVINGCPRCKPKVLSRMAGIGSEPVIIEHES